MLKLLVYQVGISDVGEDAVADLQPGVLAQLLDAAHQLAGVTFLDQRLIEFRRDGDDILLTLPITIDEAILGGKVTTPTIDGPVGLTIPSGASSSQVLRLRARGVARAGSKTKGDQRVELKIVAPPDVDESLRDFLEEWRKTHAFDPRTNMMKGAGK